MIWQDIVITLVSVVFIVALLPSIFSYNKPSKWTSLVTCVGIGIMGICYITLGLYMSSFVAGVTALLWLILFLQKSYMEANPEYFTETELPIIQHEDWKIYDHFS